MKKFILVLTVALGLAGGAMARGLVGADHPMQTAEANDHGYLVKIGDPMPDFSVLQINGNTISLASLKGKVVMLQFTASWCSVCRKEMPFIERDICQKYKNRKDFALIGIDRDEPIPTVKKFSEDMKITYPLALDPGARVFSLIAQKEAGITRNVILNREGKIIYLTRLYNPTEFKKMTEVIASELEK